MLFSELCDYLSSIEGVSDIFQQKSRDGKDYLRFYYRETLQVNFHYVLGYVVFWIDFKAKPFTGGKIKKTYRQWLKTSDDLKPFVFITKVGNSHGFSIPLSDETVEQLPELLSSFMNVFLPAIREYIKN